jgi:hypothetical protein
MMGKAGELNRWATTRSDCEAMLFGPIGLIKHGQNVEIKQGTDLNSFVADEFSLVPVS